jgi:hypothetical protein
MAGGRAPTGDAHHQARVEADEAVLGPGGGPVEAAVFCRALAPSDAFAGGNAALDDLGELALLFGGEQRHRTDLVQVLTNRITHDCLFNAGAHRVVPGPAPRSEPVPAGGFQVGSNRDPRPDLPPTVVTLVTLWGGSGAIPDLVVAG